MLKLKFDYINLLIEKGKKKEIKFDMKKRTRIYVLYIFKKYKDIYHNIYHIEILYANHNIVY